MGFFSSLFGNSELDQMQETIQRWERVLTPTYLSLWKDWLKKRDILANKLKLNEIEVAKITCREVTRYAIFSLRRSIGITDTNHEKIATTRGNTNALKLYKMAMDEFERYDDSVRSFISIENFDKEIARVTNKR